jgi:hypothetical protein
MSSSSISLNYRPLRIGWLVRRGDCEQLREAVRLTSCLWGGKLNPIIPTDDLPLALDMAKTFGVDLLYAIEETDESKAIENAIPHLIKGYGYSSVFGGNEKSFSNFLDVHHSAIVLAKQLRDAPDLQKLRFTTSILNEDDPLRFLQTLLFGDYPKEGSPGANYQKNIKSILGTEAVRWAQGAILNPYIERTWFPLHLTTFNLVLGGSPGFINNGVLVGSATDFDDLTLFWNLCAAGRKVAFFDPAYSDQLHSWLQLSISSVTQTITGEKEFAVWHRGQLSTEGIDFGDTRPVYHHLDQASWNGLNIRPVKAFFLSSDIEVLATQEGATTNQSLKFQLPDGPFENDQPGLAGQSYVVSLKISEYGEVPSQSSFKTINIPQLNEFFSRSMLYGQNLARLETGMYGEWRIGRITKVYVQQISIGAYQVRSLFDEIMRHAGIKVTPSQSGLICSRLINQFGGAQGCRVLKVRGARRLIEKFKATESFTRSGAIETIRDIDQVTGAVGLDNFEDLHIERRDHPKLSADDVFRYLVDKEVFRVGLDLKCPSCLLASWIDIDSLSSKPTCAFCGSSFKAAVQLKDRGDWRFRRSGLFGHDNNQEGSIPVALTVQQLDSNLSDHALVYSTSVILEKEGASIERCEVDFLMLGADSYGGSARPVQLVLGECKTNKPINDEDIRKLGKVLDAVPSGLAETFVMFSKTAAFEQNEINLAKTLNRPNMPARVILWSIDELEPYLAYERANLRLATEEYALDFLHMSEVTNRIYFGGQ